MNDIKMMEPIRLRQGVVLTGQIVYEGLFQIVSRFDVASKGGMCKIVRSMTYDSEHHPMGESAALPYGMVCHAFQQFRIVPVN